MTRDRRDAGADDRWLGEVLHDAVADVEPRQDLAGIRDRIEEDAMRTRTRNRWAAAAAGLTVAATVTAVAWATGIGTGGTEGPLPAASPTADASEEPATSGATEPTDAASDSSDTATDEPSSAPPAPFDGPLAVYYVGDTPTGPRLFREFRAPTAERGDALAMAVQMALEVAPDDPDYRDPWPDGATAEASHDEEGDLLTVDVQGDAALRERPSGMPDDEARMALEQLMYTAQAAIQARPPVRFLLNGEPTDQLLGRPVSEPLVEGEPMEVQAPVWIIDPQDGTALNALLVQGRGAFFEANVSWQVLEAGPDGPVVKEGFATAEECCTLSPYRFEITGLEPGDYVLRVYDADVSGGEGPGEHEDTKRFTLTG